MRDSVPVNVTVPAVSPDEAHAVVVRSGCRTAKVKVADPRASLADDVARVEAVRDALGPGGAVRVDANGAWDVDTAVAADPRARPGRRRPGVRRAALRARSTSWRPSGDGWTCGSPRTSRSAAPTTPCGSRVVGAADVAVLKCTPLGGVVRALRVAEAAGLPCVVSSALETSVGLAAELALAGALPELDFACGLGTLALLDGDLVPDAVGLRPVDGRLPVPLTPPVPDPALLDTHAADPERERWWHGRLARVAKLLMMTKL